MKITKNKKVSQKENAAIIDQWGLLYTSYN